MQEIIFMSYREQITGQKLKYHNIISNFLWYLFTLCIVVEALEGNICNIQWEG